MYWGWGDRERGGKRGIAGWMRGMDVRNDWSGVESGGRQNVRAQQNFIGLARRGGIGVADRNGLTRHGTKVDGVRLWE